MKHIDPPQSAVSRRTVLKAVAATATVGLLGAPAIALSLIHISLAQSLKGLAKNPMIMGITAGIVFSALDVHLPAVISSTIQLVATAASPVALFVIGGSLVGLKLTGQRTDMATVAPVSYTHLFAVFRLRILLPSACDLPMVH